MVCVVNRLSRAHQGAYYYVPYQPSYAGSSTSSNILLPPQIQLRTSSLLPESGEISTPPWSHRHWNLWLPYAALALDSPSRTCLLLRSTHLAPWSWFGSSIDSDISKFIERWLSDKMIQYLHVQANPIMRILSFIMVNHGTYTMIPSREVSWYLQYSQTSLPYLPLELSMAFGASRYYLKYLYTDHPKANTV